MLQQRQPRLSLRGSPGRQQAAQATVQLGRRTIQALLQEMVGKFIEVKDPDRFVDIVKHGCIQQCREMLS